MGKRVGKVEGSPGYRFLGSGARRNNRREQIDGGLELRAAPMVNGRRSFNCRRLSRGGAWPGVGEDGGAHQEPILGVDLGGEGPEKQIDRKGWSSGDAPMAAGDGGPIPAGKARVRLGEVRGRWRTR